MRSALSVACRLDVAAVDRAAAGETADARPLAMNGYKCRLVQGLMRRALREVTQMI